MNRSVHHLTYFFCPDYQSRDPVTMELRYIEPRYASAQLLTLLGERRLFSMFSNLPLLHIIT